MSLGVEVVEVRGLAPRSGWQQGLSHALAGTGLATAAALEPAAREQELPVPVVQVFCGAAGFEVAATGPTLNPMFAKNGHTFESVPLRSDLRVTVVDRRGRFGLDARPLGTALLPAAAVPGGDGPVFLWLPLAEPGGDDAGTPLKERISTLLAGGPGAGTGEARQRELRRPARAAAADASAARRRAGSLSPPPRRAAGGAAASAAAPQLQVLLRLQVSRPRLHNALTTVKLSLAGLQLNTKTFAASELLNLTVDRVHAMVLRTTRELQLTLAVQAVQLDNQALDTHHPVVLAPSSSAGLYAGAQVRGGAPGWGVLGPTPRFMLPPATKHTALTRRKHIPSLYHRHHNDNSRCCAPTCRRSRPTR